MVRWQGLAEMQIKLMQGDGYYYMSFRDKFQGKINTVNKRGLKHTLFDGAFKDKEDMMAKHRYTFSHSKQPQLETGIEQPMLQRRSTCQELPSKKENTMATFMSRPLLEKNHHKKTSQLFIDEMLDKHRNLLRIIDHKTSYRITRTK